MFHGSMADKGMTQQQGTCPLVLMGQGGQASRSDKSNILAGIVDVQDLLEE